MSDDEFVYVASEMQHVNDYKHRGRVTELTVHGVFRTEDEADKCVDSRKSELVEEYLKDNIPDVDGEKREEWVKRSGNSIEWDKKWIITDLECAFDWINEDTEYVPEKYTFSVDKKKLLPPPPVATAVVVIEEESSKKRKLDTE